MSVPFDRNWVRISGGLIALFLMAGPALGLEKHENTLNGILKVNVSSDGYVDYDQIRVNRGGDLYQFLSMVEVEDLADMSEKDRAAFWINAYNAYVVKSILAQSTLEKLSGADPIFDEKVKVARWRLSLNAIRDRVLRSDPDKGGGVQDLSIPQFNPLIHFALCNGTLGGPNLNKSQYSGANLDDELKEAAGRFINDPRKISVGSDGKLHLSSLFDWYAKDFDSMGGVPGVIKAFLDPKVRADAPQILALLGNGYPANAVFDYDWTLNSVKFKK